MATTKTLRVMIVDDNRLIRDGLKIFLKIFDDLEFVGDAGNGAIAIEMCDKTQPDVILMDVMMPHVNGIQATNQIIKKYPHIKIVGLTSFSSDEDNTSLMLAAGASACLPKQASIDEIIRTIRGC